MLNAKRCYYMLKMWIYVNILTHMLIYVKNVLNKHLPIYVNIC